MAYIDEYGVEFSDNYKELIRCPKDFVGEYVIPNGTEVIMSAFFECQGLTSVKIPDSVKVIEGFAFFKCINLTSITIPMNVTKITGSAFALSGVREIHVDKRNKTLDSREDCNAVINTATDTLVAGCKSTVIPESVKVIGYRSFYGCNELKSVRIPNSVTAIYDGAFANTHLTSIRINPNIEYVGEDAFEYCRMSEIVVDDRNEVYDSRDNCNAIIDSKTNRFVVVCQGTTIPKSITAINGFPFYCCKVFDVFRIPSHVIKVEKALFVGCHMNGIIVDEKNEVYDSRDNCNALIHTATDTLISGCKNTIIPKTVRRLGVHAFSECFDVTSMTIPANVTSVCNYAFLDCLYLTSVKIEGRIIYIGRDVFDGCPELKSIIIPKGLKDYYIKNGFKRYRKLLVESEED